MFAIPASVASRRSVEDPPTTFHTPVGTDGASTAEETKVSTIQHDDQDTIVSQGKGGNSISDSKKDK